MPSLSADGFELDEIVWLVIVSHHVMNSDYCTQTILFVIHDLSSKPRTVTLHHPASLNPSLTFSAVSFPSDCSLLSSLCLCLCCLTVWLSFLQMDVVYTFQTGQAAVPGALRRQPSVVSQHNDATAAKTLSSPTHVGLSSSSSLTNSAGAPPPAAAASSSTAGSESVTGGQLTPRFSV